MKGIAVELNLDLHIHSEYSCDAKCSIYDICISAIEKGMKYICITDHVDFNENDRGYGYYDAADYFKEFNRCQNEFKNDITLLSGLEFSEPHIYKTEFSKIKNLGYDMIIGSIHYLGDYFIGQRQLMDRDKNDIQKQYFSELIEMIDTCEINVVGHLDRPKIVLGDMPIIEDYIDNILNCIINNDAAIEINTRAFRKGWDELMPSEWIVRRYLEMGGDKIVIGSDAHFVNEIGAGYCSINEVYGDDLSAFLGVYKNGKFTQLPV